VPRSLLLIIALTALTGEDGPPRFPRTPPTEASAAVATFRTLHGFRMGLIAAEPLVFDPVAAASDEDGRLYVVGMSDYPHVDPNRQVAPDYLEYAVALDDGRVLTRLVAAESAASLTLRRAEGSEDTVLRTNIEAIKGTGKSLMPEGLEDRVSPPEMADLIAFLPGVQQ
jgi:hypothetical protein